VTSRFVVDALAQDSRLPRGELRQRKAVVETGRLTGAGAVRPGWPTLA
jgi:hypothetical protein